ncbi:MAG: hypothetical protein AAB583_06390 [Patescibacteria group bacterium]
MYKNSILLSLGTILWTNVKQAISLAKETGFDGLEILPTRIILNEKLNASDLSFVKGIHHNWRLDIGQDKKYGINILTSLAFILIRLIFFPSVSKSRTFLLYLSKTINCPVTVHDISSRWTKDNSQKEFKGGIMCEILDTTLTPQTLKDWLNQASHFIVIDTRDDQSLLWAKKYGFNDWKEFWIWIGLKKIKSIQLTLIGTSGINKILKHQKTLAEEQLIWMNEQKWKGSITVEVNPISLLTSNKGRLKAGLKIISAFARQTLIHGKKWSY